MFRCVLIFAVCTIYFADGLPASNNEGRAGGLLGLFGNILGIPNRRPSNTVSNSRDSRNSDESNSNAASVSLDDLDDNLQTVAATCQEKIKGLNLVRLANNKIYWLANQWELTWNAAREECISRGMHLASINSIFENIVVKDYIEREQGTTINDVVWFAVNDVNNDGVPVDDYTGIPPILSDWSGSTLAQGECGSIFVYAAGEVLWEDVACDEPIPFICEMDSICEKFVKPQYYPLYTN